MSLPTYQNDQFVALSQPTTTKAITISDSTDLTGLVTKGILVFVPSGVQTTVAYKLLGDTAAVSAVLQSTQYIPGSFLRVMSTGTTLNGGTIIGFGG